jgi:hypothetical protein
VKSIRKGLNMTQAGFSDAFGFSLDAVKHWEGGRRTPEASARAFLTVISRNPDAVISALHPDRPTQITFDLGPFSQANARSTRTPPILKQSRHSQRTGAYYGLSPGGRDGGYWSRCFGCRRNYDPVEHPFR